MTFDSQISQGEGVIKFLMELKSSSAGSATLGDTSWARLIIKLWPSNKLKKQSVASSCKLELARSSTLLRIQGRAKCGKGTELQGGDIAHTGWPKIRYTIFWLFFIWSLNLISLLCCSMHFSKWSSIQWGTILKRSFSGKYLKISSNLANCAIWNIVQDFSVINVFWYLKNARAVFMFENCINIYIFIQN